MKKAFKYLLLSVVLVMGLSATPTSSVQAQCPMCKMAVESNLKDGGTAGKGLNKGILYIFMTPYLVIATLGFFWYRNRPRDEEESPVS